MNDDYVLAALEEVLDALRQNADDALQVQERAEAIIDGRTRAGKPYRQLILDQHPPLIVELLSEKLERLAAAGSRWRRAHARALYDEGMTMEQIAAAFGVSRQRVSALLRDHDRATQRPESVSPR